MDVLIDYMYTCIIINQFVQCCCLVTKVTYVALCRYVVYEGSQDDPKMLSDFEYTSL